MKLIRVSNQNRRDFTGVYKCESCGHEKTGSGYDDRYFHHDVIPAMLCPVCEESTVSLGLESTPRATRYPDSQVV